MQHGAVTLSAAMAFYALTSLAPLLVIAVSIAGAFLGEEAVQAEIVADLQIWMGPGAATLVEELIQADWFSGSGALASGVSLAVFLFSSTVAMEHLRDSLNRVWEVKREGDSLFLSLLRGRLLSFALVLTTGLVLLASLTMRTVVATLDNGVGEWIPFDSALVGAVEFGTSLLGVTLMFTLLFRFLPDARTPWRHLIVGAAVTGLLFLAGEFLIGLYLGYVGIESPYGAVGSLVVLLFWIYYSSMVFLWGAEFTCLYSLRSDKTVPADPGASPPTGGEGGVTAPGKGH